MLALALLLTAPRPVTLAAVGDVMLARWCGRRIQRQGSKAMLAGVSGALRPADLVYGNLECALTSSPAIRNKRIVLHANACLLPALHQFDLLSLANNHAGDCGPAGLEDAARRMRLAKIEPLLPAAAATVLTRRGLRIGFIGLSDLPGYPLDPQWRDRVATARRRCDVLVVGIHWGVEGLARPTPGQRAVAKALAAAGVDVVLGSHPHLVQPVAVVRGRVGKPCLVAYSLGNFVFDARPGPASRSEILYAQFTRAGVTAYAVRPCSIRDCFPIASGGRLRWLRTRRGG